MLLDSRHREALTAHLLSLGRDDRADRFTGTVNDDYVRRYVDAIGYTRDILIGALEGRKLVGLAHAAVYLEHGELVSEVGVSVDVGARRHGLGKRLLLAAIDAAKQFNVRRVYVLFRTANKAMAGLTRSVGGRIERDGSESSAVFEINAGPQLPLRTRRNSHGTEVLQAMHPHEQGRALLVHEAGGDSYQWLPHLVPALWTAGFSVCAPTLPGHGRGGDPLQAHLDELQTCVTESAESYTPTLIVGYSLGGYLVQCHLQTRPVERAVLLASLPPNVHRSDDLCHVKAELRCSNSRAVLDLALTGAPDVDVRAVSRTPLVVLGGARDRVVPMHWVRHTALRYGVEPQFVNGGHRLMLGRAANEVIIALAA
jgi:pimeloyl-ACP methyl ester carboxylesterase/GNAT superfamily N-acetyltransferase